MTKSLLRRSDWKQLIGVTTRKKENKKTKELRFNRNEARQNYNQNNNNNKKANNPNKISVRLSQPSIRL